MLIPEKQLKKKLDRAVPPLFQRAALLLIDKCYRHADSTARDTLGLRQEIAPWARSYIRRSLIQSHLFELAVTYPTLNAEWRETIQGGNKYLAIEAGEFVLTEAKINEAGCLPVQAEYRSTNSAMSYSLFPTGKKDGSFYGIIAHVPHPKEPRPVYVSIIFPDLEYTRVVHQIDLLDAYGDHLFRSQLEETQEADPQPKLRKTGTNEQEAQA